MRKILTTALFALLIIGCGGKSAKALNADSAVKEGSNYMLQFSIQDALNSPLARQKLDGSIKFLFGSKSGSGLNIVSKDLVANKRANGVGKDGEISCQRAFISALITLQGRAKEAGASKVVNIVSYFKKGTFDSKTAFECADGNLMSGVTLKADLAK